MQLGHDLLVAKFPRDVAATQNNFASASASQATLSNAQAYWKMRGDKLGPQPKVQHWTEKTPPKSFQRPSEHPGYGANSEFYKLTMTGKIAVGVIVASGPDDLAISDSEYSTIKSEVMSGLDFWTDNAPASADLSFVFYLGVAYITASNPTSCSSYAACHNVFADPGVQYFNFETKEYLAQSCKQAAAGDGAYLAFFSKYRQSHFAYAYFEGGPIYMQYIAMTVGVLTRLTGCLLTKLDMSLTLLMNTLSDTTKMTESTDITFLPF